LSRTTTSGARALLVLALVAGPAAPAVVRAATLTPQEQVETRLMCYCGCTDLTVRTCSCGTAADIKQDIAQRLASGQTADAVVAAYVDKYGEQIRSAPTTSGFNLVAWVMPFVAILAGAVLIVQLTRRWRGPATRPAAAGGASPPALDPGRLSAEERKTLERIEREIREDF
jgi:cytochrome c-type biogenesis protein CcmH